MQPLPMALRGHGKRLDARLAEHRHDRQKETTPSLFTPKSEIQAMTAPVQHDPTGPFLSSADRAQMAREANQLRELETSLKAIVDRLENQLLNAADFIDRDFDLNTNCDDPRQLTASMRFLPTLIRQVVRELELHRHGR